MATIYDQACEMLANLEERTRANGKAFYCLKDDAPEWMRDAVREAHGGMLPDDWRYGLIWRSLHAIAAASDEEEYDDDDDGFDDRLSDELDSAVDVYHARLTAWLASNLARLAYCDDAQEYGPFDSIAGTIAAGQLCELREVADSLMATFRARCDDILNA